MKLLKEIKKHIFIYNTLLIIISGAFIKLLGLINKIIITRLLGTEGMSLYVLAFPSIILFISLSGFSLNITCSKLISEGLSTKRYSPKLIMKASLKLALKTSIIVETLFLLSISFLVNRLLKTPDLYLPLLMTAFLIPLVGITDTLRGVFAGYQKMKTVALVNIIEQIARMIFSIGGILLFSKYGIITSVTLTILALTIGEAASLVYLICKLKTLYLINFENTENEKKAVWKMAFPTTLSRLIGSITYFLEPILNTLILLHLGYDKKVIDFDYTIINAYIIPIMTICIFLSTAISTTSIPAISEKCSDNRNELLKIIDKIFFCAITPGLIISIILFLYPKEYLNLLFSNSIGYKFVKKYVFLFLLHYIQSPGISILQAFGKSKQVFKICTLFNLFKLVLIIILAYIPFIGSYTLFYSILIVMVFETLTIWFYIFKISSYIPNCTRLINLILIGLFVLSIGLLMSNLINLPIIISIVLFIIFTSLILKFKILNYK